MNATKIEWCDKTINPVVGCSYISSGCDHCYAERFAARLAKHPNPKIRGKYEGVVDEAGKWTGETSALDLSPFHKLPQKDGRVSRRVFVGSMADLFYRRISFDDLRKIWKQMAFLSQHTFCILTKRPLRMYAFCEDNANPPPPNLWIGVTVCNQAEADEKIPILLQTPAANRFVSIEPMLGPVDIGKYLYGSYECALSCGTRLSCDARPERRCCACGFVGPDDYATWGDGPSPDCPECHENIDDEEVCPDCGTYMVQGHPDTQYIDWVICGGETGPGARPVHPDWVRSLRDQCQAAGTPYFFKGWGEWTEDVDPMEYDPCSSEHTFSRFWCEKGMPTTVYRVGKKRAGRLLDGREWSEVPV